MAGRSQKEIKEDDEETLYEYEHKQLAMNFAWYVVHYGYYLKRGWRKNGSNKKFTIQDIFAKYEAWKIKKLLL